MDAVADPSVSVTSPADTGSAASVRATVRTPEDMTYDADDIAGGVASSYDIACEDAAPLELPHMSVRPPAANCTLRGCDRASKAWRVESSSVIVIVSESCEIAAPDMDAVADPSVSATSPADTDCTASARVTMRTPEDVAYDADDTAGGVISSYDMASVTASELVLPLMASMPLAATTTERGCDSASKSPDWPERSMLTVAVLLACDTLPWLTTTVPPWPPVSVTWVASMGNAGSSSVTVRTDADTSYSAESTDAAYVIFPVAAAKPDRMKASAYKRMRRLPFSRPPTRPVGRRRKTSGSTLGRMGKRRLSRG